MGTSLKKPLSIAITPELLRDVDSVRGRQSRSAYIASVLQDEIDSKWATKEPRAQFSAALGCVYTPSSLANLLAVHAWNALSAKTLARGDVKALDPACGEGELLQSIARVSSLNKVNVSLSGIDVDRTAISYCRSRSFGAHTSTQFLCTDALAPYGFTRDKGWQRCRTTLTDGMLFDLVIANPPWGLPRKRTGRANIMQEYVLARGQYDSSDLFLEASIEQTAPGGVLAFLVPDSLFQVEREPLRRHLLANCDLLQVHRLGEGFFEGIARGCAVVVLRRKKRVETSQRNHVLTARLSGKGRQQILSGASTIQDIIRSESKAVPIWDFVHPDRSTFLLHGAPAAALGSTRWEKESVPLRECFKVARGVELSKKGFAAQCGRCLSWTPLPSRAESSCPSCGSVIKLATARTDEIISKEFTHGAREIIVGEAVQRHSIQDTRFIALGRQGINYKPEEVYRPEKIVVRKTGVGISAALDYESRFTNQVVFSITPSVKHAISLELVLAWICSRPFHYHFFTKYGETDWRSHPYITQAQILDFPLPNALAAASNLAKPLRKLFKSGRGAAAMGIQALDLSVEQLLAKALGLKRSDYERYYEYFEQCGDLRVVRQLTAIEPSVIVGV